MRANYTNFSAIFGGANAERKIDQTTLFCRSGGFGTDTNAAREYLAQSRIDYRWGTQILPPGDCLS